MASSPFKLSSNPTPVLEAERVSEEYMAGVTNLNSHRNVELFSYVHCNCNNNSGHEVNRNVTQWNSWNADPETTIDGIFYDEIPNEEGDNKSVVFLASLVKAATSTFVAHPFKSIFNPCAISQNTELYDAADYIVVFESEASAYNESVLSNQIPAGKASQSSILVCTFASDGDKMQPVDSRLGCKAWSPLGWIVPTF